MSVYWSGAKQDSDGASEGSAWSRGRSSLFVGSFNINSQDLTQEDAKRWLQHAADADIVALGLQVLGHSNTNTCRTYGKPDTASRHRYVVRS